MSDDDRAGTGGRRLSRRTVLRHLGVAGALVAAPGLAPAARTLASVPSATARWLDGLPVARQGSGQRDQVSARIETPIPFTTIGFRLPGRGSPAFRTSSDGRRWTPWTTISPLPATEGPEGGADEDADGWQRWSHPRWVGDARWLQVRGTDVERLRVALIDSVGLGGSLLTRAGRALTRGLAAAGTPAVAVAASQPPIITREEWGADESWRNGDPRYADAAEFAVIHHTAGSNDYEWDDVPGIIRGIYHYHTQTLGWDDIGYNFLVDKWGRLFEGRYGGVDRPVIGAHARGYNTGSIGIAGLGCYDPSCDDAVWPWRSMIDGADELTAWKFTLHGINPYGTSTVDSHTFPNIVGHRDVGSTVCPGDNLHYHVRGPDPMDDRVAALMPATELIPRIAGADRVATAVALCQWAFDAAEHVVLASSETWPDGLAAGPLAGSLDAPVLLSASTHLPEEVATEIRRLGAGTVWLAGGTNALSEQVEHDLGADADIADGNIHRVAGANRFETAAEITTLVVGREEPDTAILALGHHHERPEAAFADALSASGLAASDRLPVLLVENDRLPEPTRRALSDRSWPGGLYVIGGSSAISEEVVLEARAAANGAEATRLEGSDRYGTSTAVVEEWRLRGARPAEVVLVATGSDWPDALAAGAATPRRGAAFLLVDPTDLDRSEASRDWFEARSGEIDGAWASGGAAAIADEVREAIALIVD